MKLEETPRLTPKHTDRFRMAAPSRARVLRALGLALALLLTLGVIARSAVPGTEVTWRAIDTTIAHWDWDAVGWELDAISGKINAQFLQPVAGMNDEARATLVRTYLDRAQVIAQIEVNLGILYADPSHPDHALIPELEARLKGMKEQQGLIRPAVELILEQQVANELKTAGIQWGGQTIPPVWFTFSEPPRKLIVSPRDKIDTVYWSMLEPELPPDERERIEMDILKDEGLSAYVTNIGGLGAYPSLVVDSAPLSWVLSTVAHEWVHNYLTLFPLGLSYGANAENTILNETIADIIGDEVGAKALFSYYPELVREHPGKDDSAPTTRVTDNPVAFDFRKEMRQTRETVDLFLKYGRIKDAEQYMEIRRLLFQENGFNIRKLNQAYFAFHGSYGTGAAASSPIGEKLQRLRSLLPDLKSFLETVRWFTSEADLDRKLAELE